MKRIPAVIVALLLGSSCGTNSVRYPDAFAGGDAPAPVLQAELQAYWLALAHVCQTGVTPELVRRYEAAVSAFDAANYGRGRDSNFAGPRPPYFAYRDCFRGVGRLRR